MSKPIIGISIGDPNGIGPEVILKTLGNREVTKILTPVIYASAALLDACQELLGTKISYQEINDEDEIADGRINLVSCLDESVELSMGQSTAAGGKVGCCFFGESRSRPEKWPHQRPGDRPNQQGQHA